MEDNQKKNTEYTGEYGNPVETAKETQETKETKDSTYSYSYQNGNGETTHSGDYYAGNHQAEYQQVTDHDPANHNYFNNAQGYQTQNSNGPVPTGQPQKTKKAKKPDNGNGLMKKLLICAACAVVFGVVAGVCFQGVRYVSDQFMPSRSSQVQLKTTTQQGSTTADSSTASEDEVKTTEVSTTDVSGVVEQTMPAIVAITSTTQGANYYDLFGQEYAGQESTSAGSGFIIAQNDNELLIATNNHVIEDAKTISVQFIDDEIYEATVKGTDSANDLAVIAVATKDIKEDTMNQIAIADIGSSDDLKVGEMVIAIGNALGYGQSVTVGYVSAKDREITTSEENSYNANSSANTIKAIQTDAAINPGNSGGALINMRGEVIGINSAKIADSTVEGIGYAIPISVANPIIEDLMNKETLSDEEKGYLGISGQTVTDAATAFNIPNGVQVVELAEGGAAEEAGIQVGDIITSINNMEVRSIESLQEKANSYKKGTEVEITVQRSDNGTYKEQKFTVKLQGSSSLDSLNSDTKSSSNDSDSKNSEDNPNGGDNGNSGKGNGNYGDSDEGDGFGNLFDFFN